MMDTSYTQRSSDPRLAFPGLSDNEELFSQPCLGRCLHSSLISIPVADPVQKCSVPKGKNTLQSSSILHWWSSWVTSASGNHLIKDSFPSAVLTWQSPGLSNCSIFKLLFREEIPAALSCYRLLKWSSLEVNSAIHSIKECRGIWPGILTGSWRIHFPPQINLQWKRVPNLQLIKSTKNYQLLETSNFYHFGSESLFLNSSAGNWFATRSSPYELITASPTPKKPWAPLYSFIFECGEKLDEKTGVCRSQRQILKSPFSF